MQLILVAYFDLIGYITLYKEGGWGEIKNYWKGSNRGQRTSPGES